ncbi:MAG: serine/threonine protein kinase [Acidimicrobiia bacterium]|nr:serine/threonine protein kinase [Acidimicrobiia bacterium]
MPLEPGQTISHYRLVEKLGQGGMGEVFKAWDERLNRNVAIKVLRADKGATLEMRQRFLQEARAASALNHPNIITIYDIFSEGDADFMVMEFVDGKSLSDSIPKGGLRVSQALPLAVQVADALASAHEAGIVHRDLKPGNVMVTKSGAAKLLDFGLAKLTHAPIAETDETATNINAPVTVVGAVMGTARYMSPEQAEGMPVDARSDIFTFAVVLYEMLTGECAFQASTTISTLAAVIRDEPRSVREISKEVPPDLEQLIHKSIRKSAAQRPQTMREVHTTLAELQKSWESVAPAAVPAPQQKKPAAKPAAAKSRVKLVWAALIVLIFGATAAMLFLRQSAPPPEEEASALVEQAAAPPTEPAPATAEPEPASAPSEQQKKTSAPAASRAPKQAPPQKTATPEPARVSAPAQQQEAAPPPAPAPAPATPKPTTVYSASLADGAPILLVLDNDVALNIEEGSPMTFTVARDVKIGDLLVIARGAKAKAIVAEGARKRILRDTKPKMLMESVIAVDGKQVRLREQTGKRNDRKPMDIEPADKNARSKDKAIVAPKGVQYVGYIDGTVLIQARKAETP